MLPSFELVNNCANAIWDKIDMSTMVLSMKGVAVVFMLITWWGAYKKSITKEGEPFDVWTFIYGVLYIGVVVQCDQIIELMNSIMTSVGTAYVDMFPMPESDFDMFQNSSMIEYNTDGNIAPEEGLWDTVCNFFNYIFSLDWIYDMVAKVCLMFTIVFDYIYFMAREFMLFLMKLFLPIIMAMAVLDKFRDLAWRWIKLTIAVYLLGYVYIVAIGFSNSFFSEIVHSFTLAGNLGVSEGNSAVGAVDVGVKILVFAMCVFGKYRMFRDGATLCFKIFA